MKKTEFVFKNFSTKKILGSDGLPNEFFLFSNFSYLVRNNINSTQTHYSKKRRENTLHSARSILP